MSANIRSAIKPFVWSLALLPAMFLPDLYIFRLYIFPSNSLLTDTIWWLPSILATITFSAAQAGLYHNTMFRTFFGLAMLFATPKLVFAITDIVLGWQIAIFASAIFLSFLLYGATYGWRRIVVRKATCNSAKLPTSFDGYRILQLSDIHIGTFLHNPKFISSLVDTVNRQHADIVVFTGDIINADATELLPFRHILSKIEATDGVFSVMGNHDYCEYSQGSLLPVHGRQECRSKRNSSLLVYMQKKMGWRVLMNENVTIKHDNQSISIIGVENIGMPPFKSFGNLEKAMTGLPDGTFKVLLSHDPTHWRRGVLHKTDITLTLSGHTHAGQVKIGKFSPAKWAYNEWGGKYTEGEAMLYVSLGIGGTMPFRFGAWPEINVITLKNTL